MKGLSLLILLTLFSCKGVKVTGIVERAAAVPDLELGGPGSCTTDSFNGQGGVINCTNLEISKPLSFSHSIEPVVIHVAGDVLINANINLDGSNGTPTDYDPTMGGLGGPGASIGGGIFGTESTSGGDSFPPDPSEGLGSIRTGLCGNGGSGAGGVFSNGQNGGVCNGDYTYVALGGLSSNNPVPTPFRGGFGGGAGAMENMLSLAGTGGGGGGAIRISAGGRVVINSGVTISARGGNGGNSSGLNGAGGGGSGGIIVIESTEEILNQGLFDVSGGKGGVKLSASDFGANGGDGAPGAYSLIVNGTIQESSY